MGCSSGCNFASMGVCPGWQAANASLANDVIPFVSKALASAADSATSSAPLTIRRSPSWETVKNGCGMQHETLAE